MASPPNRLLPREPISEHRPAAFRGGSRGFILNNVPMLSEHAIFQTHDIQHDPVGYSFAQAGKTTMQHQEVSGCQNQLIFVPHRRWDVFLELKEPLLPSRNV